MNLKTYGIESLSTDHLKANEIAQLSADSATAVLAFVKVHKEGLLLATHANNLQTAQADFQAVPKGTVASSLVKELEVADQKRDRAYQTLLNFVKSYAYVEGKAVEDAYEQLAKLFAGHKKVVALTYEEESAQLARFFEQMATPEMVAALETLNLTAHYDNLKAAQARFAKAYQARLDEQTGTKVGVSRKQKQELQARYDYLTDLVAILAYGQPDNADLQTLKAQLNTIRKRYKDKGGKKV